jgi:hypothetical protein
MIAIPLTTSVGTAFAISAMADVGMASLSMILLDEDIRAERFLQQSFLQMVTVGHGFCVRIVADFL